ncbi:HTH domain-containing protein [Mesorhizobium koreense]|uniref:HTH domain-containing protein n=1 Tax=Mesorhizobium koreense TaxID=3074855 RepID=UPI00287B6736|nr:HTH domain-containing protein [Mesorhizobium sp. WR6]
MDSLITAAAHALAGGDPLGALNFVALRNDAPALALRGIAMAQLGDLTRAKTLLKSAARAFGAKEAMARARCAVAEAEIALISRNLTWPTKALERARITLEEHGDRANVAYARYLKARRLLLVGRLREAEEALVGLESISLAPALHTGCELVSAGIAIRRIRAKAARAALARADEAARMAAIPALMAEVEAVALVLDTPAARLITKGEARPLLLDEVEPLLASDALVVDACRFAVRCAGKVVPLETRPVLFALARALAEAWPADVSRETLLLRAFRARYADESHRARLRVEIGRLRKALRGMADVKATAAGFRLALNRTGEVVVLAPPVEEEHASVLALLADGESWSSTALALALGVSQRTVQRALETLVEEGKVQAVGQARARRWMTPPVPGFPTTLLLPAPISIG